MKARILGFLFACTLFVGIAWGQVTTDPSVTGISATTGLVSLAGTSQAFSGGILITAFDNGTKSSGTFTPVCGTAPLQYAANNGAHTLAAPAADSSCMILYTNGASAGAITFSGFSVGANTGDTLTTTNAQKFALSIWRINGTAGYRVAAHQ